VNSDKGRCLCFSSALKSLFSELGERKKNDKFPRLRSNEESPIFRFTHSANYIVEEKGKQKDSFLLFSA
jgi:hypothetical protein